MWSNLKFSILFHIVHSNTHGTERARAHKSGNINFCCILVSGDPSAVLQVNSSEKRIGEKKKKTLLIELEKTSEKKEIKKK